ncbi:MAG: hypothetical protein WA477_05615 [Candidatus Sulfotelmatobacter sp.]
MPDWKKEVRKRTRKLALSPAAKEEVIVELSDHLEEIYESARRLGLAERSALKLALQEVEDWRVLTSEIERLKSEDNPMNGRTKSLWLPAAATLLGASALLMLLQFLRVQPRLVWLGHVAMIFYWPWIASLPAFGAVGAYLSKRAHSPVHSRLVAGLSPALALLATMSLILPWGLIIDGFSGLTMGYFALAVINWVGIPGAALLIGAAPFLWERKVETQN